MGDIYPSPTLANGLLLLDEQDRLNISFFYLASNFMRDAVLGEMPSVTADTDTGMKWVEGNQGKIERALRIGAMHWSIYDIGVWAAEPGIINAVHPANYWRVGEFSQQDAEVGHIIAYRYRDKTLAEINVDSTDYYNMIKVTKLLNGKATEQLFELYGEQQIGKAVGEPVESPITQICVAGEGLGWYDIAKDLVARILIGLALKEQDINRFRNMITYLPAEVGTVIKDSIVTSEGTNPTLTDYKAEIDKLRFPYIPLMGNDVPPEPTVQLDLSAVTNHIDGLLDLLFMISGLPPSSFGIGVGRNESGIAREKAQDAASARARSFRSDLQECLPMLAKAMGFPVRGELSFTWATSPFQDRTAKHQEILQMKRDGVILVNEARTALGWQPFTKEQEAAIEQDKRDKMQMSQNSNQEDE